MRRALAIGALISGAALLAACATGQTLRDGRIARDLPLVAQPGDIVVAEIAFARMAHDKGQWTAFAEFATGDAVMFVPEPVNAQQWLRGRANPPEAVRWQVHQVWSSCDGSLAVSKGAWQRPDGSVGYFTTVWQRQDKGGFKWVMDQGDVLTEPLQEPEMVKAVVADCAIKPMPAVVIAGKPDETVRSGTAKDGSLYWRVIARADGSRSVRASYWNDHGWQTALREDVAAQ
jgi:hypothetical protein